MGYTSKENLISKLEGHFTIEELKFLEDSIEEHKELGNDVVLKIGAIDEMEKIGILSKFYTICKNHGFFPQWIENVEQGIDKII